MIDGARPAVEALYLTSSEVAELLRVDERTVLRWARRDAMMPTLRIGGTVRFPRERLLLWLRGREQGPGRPRRLRAVSEAGPR